MIRTKCVVALLALALTVAPSAAQGQTPSAGPAWTLSLELPAASRDMLNSGQVLSWSQFRKHGLVLTARGTGELSASLHVLLFQGGRLVDRWASVPLAGNTTRSPVAGKYLPSDQYLPRDNGWRVGSAVAGRPVDVSLLLRIEASGEPGGLLPAALREGAAVLIFAVPTGALPGSRTGAVSVNLEKVNDE